MKYGFLVLLALTLGMPTSVSSATTEGTTRKDRAETKSEAGQKAGKKVKDPVCGMEIDTKSAAGKATYKGKTYYFCSVSEKAEFEKNPAKYLK